MRSTALLVFVIFIALASSSCDTTQPLLADQQLLELTVLSSGFPAVGFFNVYDATSDCDSDGMPDDLDMDGQPDTFLWCLTRTQATPGTANGFPWNFTIEVTITRSDSDTPVALTSEQARESTSFSITPADTRTSYSVSPPPAQPPIFQSGCTFTFSNGRVRSTVNQDVLAATENLLAQLNPTQYGMKGSGLCSTNNPGSAVIDRASGNQFPFPITLGKGDTITVQSVRSLDPPDGILIPPSENGASIQATLSLNGAPLIVRGSLGASPGSESFSFSYTSR